MRALGGNNDGLAFTNAHESEAGEKGNKVFPDIKCYNCNKMGHYAGDCREEKKKEKTKNAEASGTTLLLNANDFDDGPSAFSFHQGSELMGDCYSQSRKLPRSWILLDNQSTVDVFMNKDLLDNIRTVATTMNIRCNAGNSRTNLQGDLRGYGTVWYNPEGIANILSLSNVKKKNRVTYDSESNGKFIVIKPDGSCREFKPSGSGLFSLDTNKGDGTGTMLINTVEDNKSKYTNRDYSNATPTKDTEHDWPTINSQVHPHRESQLATELSDYRVGYKERGRHPRSQPWIAKRKNRTREGRTHVQGTHHRTQEYPGNTSRCYAVC
jgi:hypothetical protein